MTSKSMFRLALSNGIPKRSFYATLVVGTLLNLINQGDVVLAGGTLDLLKLGLTYVVPYGVATYGAISARPHMSAG
ncbi:MAG: hypothetical protein ACE5LL_03700 [Alphaproteobacteria bacterium]